MNPISPSVMRERLKVYLIMGSVNCRSDASAVLRDAILGGVTMFQLREKGPGALSGHELRIYARCLQSVCRTFGVPFIVNDDIDLAIELDADGIHIGQDDESARVVRTKIGNKIVGVSTHTLQEAEIALADGADYLGVGPIFPTRSKDDAKPPRGTQLIRELREQGMTIPIVGIGGITPDNARHVMVDGSDGISVISAISSSNFPREAAQKLREAVYTK
ncbi:MAG: thiamine-phosphate diphosphorylase [Cohnella sp.]|jgi:thiamine-phosphate pyrophosphorylase|nr:thiamine-phosphate diphosphorylase [Cohnella sp.]